MWVFVTQHVAAFQTITRIAIRVRLSVCNRYLALKKPTDAQAKDLLRFVKHHTDVDTFDLQDLCEYFAEVHDINYSMGEI